MITTPARAFELRNSKYDWGYKATMINRPDYERVEKPHTRGKTLGGCSALNYYTWVRGVMARTMTGRIMGVRNGIGTDVSSILTRFVVWEMEAVPMQ